MCLCGLLNAIDSPSYPTSVSVRLCRLFADRGNLLIDFAWCFSVWVLPGQTTLKHHAHDDM